MCQRKMNHLCRIKLAVLLLLLLGGCRTTPPLDKADKDKYGYRLKPRIVDGVLVFLDLQQIDLDNDGKKEIVGIYNAGLNLRGVKVIKENSQTDNKVIFSKVFNTNNLRIKIKKGVLTLIMKDRDSAGCGLTKFYHWDGKEFIFAR